MHWIELKSFELVLGSGITYYRNFIHFNQVGQSANIRAHYVNNNLSSVILNINDIDIELDISTNIITEVFIPLIKTIKYYQDDSAWFIQEIKTNNILCTIKNDAQRLSLDYYNGESVVIFKDATQMSTISATY